MPASIRIANSYATIEISPLGSEMQSLTLPGGSNLLWNGDAAFWTGRSPVLFPIVGKAADDTVLIDGTPYPMAQHGFARRREFRLAHASDASCRFELESSDQTRAVYPFDFILSVDHRLDGPALTVAAEVHNRGDRTMPFGCGFHPAFVWPLPGAEGKPHYIQLANGGEPIRQPLSGGLLSPERRPSPFREGKLSLHHALFDEDALVFPDGIGDALTYAAEGGPALDFRFKNLPNVAFWTKPGAPFLCVEPWHGTAAIKDGSRALADRPFTTHLAPGGTARFAFTVTLPS